jgi:hypothetical protein
MSEALLATSLAMGGLLLLAQNESHSAPNSAPVKTILTVEARHDHDKNVPLLNRKT